MNSTAIASTARASQRLRALVERLPGTAAAVAVGVGALTLFGWLTGTTALTHPLPGPPMMLANAAVMVLLAGVALGLSRRANGARWAQRTARACAIAVCAIAGATLVEYVVGLELGIDRLLAGGRIGTFPIGRPAPHVAVAYALLGAALLAGRRTTARGRVPADYLAVVAAMIAGAALLGHLFGAPAAHGLPSLFAYIGVSVPGALVIVLLAAGILALNAERGLVSLVLAAGPGGLAARRLLFGLVTFAPVALLIVLGARFGWYAVPIASALAVLVALTVGCSLVLVTAAQLSRNDAVIRTAIDALQASEQAERTLATELALAYAAERSRRGWLQNVIDQLPEGVIVVDARGNVEAVNRAARAWASREDGDGHVTFDTRTPDGAPVAEDDLPIVRALRTRAPTATAEYVLHSRGQPRPITARATPVRDDADELTGAVVVIHDVSEHREAERLRDEWTAVIAHDLRGPVATILMTVEAMLEVEPADARDEDRRAVRRIRRSASRLHRMIDDLLDAALITSNRLAINRKRVDVVDCVSIAIDSVRLAHPDAEVAFDAPPRHHAWADCDRIDQIVENLLTNAVKYGTPGAPIRVAITPRAGATEISVTNAGSAIPADELPRLFGRFRRTAGARASGTAGLGLGLYICKGLVDAHGGTIAVTSDAGSTRFAFTLPDLAEPRTFTPAQSAAASPG